MSASRDPDGLIRSFLMQGEELLSDPIYDAVRAEIEQKRQLTFVGPWRTSLMNRSVTLGLGAAAVVIVALIVGAQLLGSPRNSVGAGEATPTPPASTASPTASASPSPTFPSWYSSSEADGAGILPAGTHETVAFQPAFSFTVPAGWVNDTDSASYFGLFPDTPANQAQFERSEALAQNIFMGFNSSPYFTCQSAEDNTGATAAELVADMEANDVLAVSNAADVAIGGLTGKQVDVRRNPDWAGTCPEDSDLPAGVDPDQEGARAIMLDAPGRGVLLIFLYSMSPADTEAFLAEAMPIVESFQFSP